MHVKPEEQANYRNRKKFLSQNVFAAVNFDGTFSFVHAGWEGSAHDSKVLFSAIDHGFPIKAGYYYLADAGYGLQLWSLTPYRGVRYHLKEWSHAIDRPQNAKELFNLRHSSLRIVVERVFGIVKKRFPVLVNMAPYSVEDQVYFVYCCCFLHNWIVRNQGFEDVEYDLGTFGIEEDDADVPVAVAQPKHNENLLANWRDGIAASMFAQYINYTA
jgi:hypothetical protein